ncbi:Cytochrome c553 [Roseovarius pacificus]|uniref:Cytochrome c553 n=1 Tax=Roseovarius pacificus TaxID=337701 RepID=A0A1M7JN23_9RHOB|nr:c-type cytochrome [Roseovarius pacificus]GGO58540.1 cytochrome c [Roseovarius pacificus]SHM54376.1 Cytochrome c553 [Roseovarius pacificus]
MRAVLLTLAVLAALGLAGAVSVVGLGLYNVSAHAGHWPGVSWILHTTFRNSVRLRAPSMEDAPRLDDPDLIALGAGHYATACAGCHGAPGVARTATVRAMVPEPPLIGEAVESWRPNELHWIVENGVKMSGMPGWPVQGRGDEVWAVVAYLVSVRERMAPALPANDGAGVAYCRTCHEKIGGPVPRLDILDAEYLEAQLDLYASGARPGGIMAQAVSRVRKDDFGALARELAQGDAPVFARDAPRLDGGDGAALARRGNRDVPACLACHGDTGKGPALFGQSQDYLTTQLKLWRDGTYVHDNKMHAAARDLTDADIDALSRYFANSAE